MKKNLESETLITIAEEGDADLLEADLKTVLEITGSDSKFFFICIPIYI